MENRVKKSIGSIKSVAQKGINNIDVEKIKDKASVATETILDKAESLKETAISTKDDIIDKLAELDNMLKDSIAEYNDAYTLMNDKGIQLYVERTRSIDTIAFTENIINSIANCPKSFDADVEEIQTNRKLFTDSCEFAERELQEARNVVTGAGAGLATAASVTFMAPTAAMWIATTFGTSSTGVAISTLSGAAAENAALAWLGGGALSAGGKGIVGGKALLALSGPLGVTITGVTILSSILILTTKKVKLNKQKNEEILAIKQNTETIREMDASISVILNETVKIRSGVNELLTQVLHLYGKDYSSFDVEKKQLLGTLINNTKALSAILGKTIGEEQ